jgi:hypothetical protein
MAGVITAATEAVNLIPKRWNPGLKLEAQEEMIGVKNFSEATDAQLINGQLYFRKIKRINSTAMTADGTGLTYSNNVETAPSCTPTREHAAVQISGAVIDRMDISPISPYRTQIKAGLGTGVDVAGMTLAAGLSTNVVGNGGVNLDQALLLEAQGKLIGSSRNKFNPGISPAYLTIHHTQIRFIMGIFNLTADSARGDAEHPLVTGWIIKALGMMLNESGNVYQAAGITHNLLHTDDAFAIAYNRQPTILDPQPLEDTIRIIGVVEHGEVELFDEYAVDIQTAA